MIDNFDLVISHNSESINREGVYHFDEKLQSEDKRLAQRIVSFYYGMEENSKYVDHEDQRDRLKRHFSRAIIQPVVWPLDAQIFMHDSYCTLRKSFSQIHLHRKKSSRVNTDHLR